MNIENYFEQEKGITVDSARNAGARYTAIDICRFAKLYHESELKKLRVTDVMSSQKQVDPEIQRALNNFSEAQVGREPKKKRF